MARRVEEGEVNTIPRSVEMEVERMKNDMETLLWKKEDELVAALKAAEQGVNDQDCVTVEMSAESRGIYPVLDSLTSPV